MLIYLNGEERPVTGNLTVNTLLEEIGFAGKRVAVEVNQEIVPRSNYTEFLINDNDRVEVVRAIGGG
ncbi:MAG: sulfur carrier protein ThiS [Gammaproteobacteria bacterium]|nr:MAG: sulfur carrier protein ThiS [Gammaproteobacteria bacterium]